VVSPSSLIIFLAVTKGYGEKRSIWRDQGVIEKQVEAWRKVGWNEMSARDRGPDAGRLRATKLQDSYQVFHHHCAVAKRTKRYVSLQ